MQTDQIDDAEKQQFELFRKKLNQQAAEAQVSKLEYNLANALTDKATLRNACQEANALKLGAICVLPDMVGACVAYLGKQTKTSVIACISFPHGGDVTKVKVAAIKNAVKDGADEVEVTVPIAFVKEKNWAYVKREFKKLKVAAKKRAIRINIGSEYLTPEEITKICSVATDCGITALNTVSDADHISCIFTAVKDKCTIKADNVASVTDMVTAFGLGAGIIGSRNAVNLARLVLNEYEI